MKVTVNKPTPAQMAAAEQEYLIRSFDGPLGIEPPYSEHYVRRLHTNLPIPAGLPIVAVPDDPDV